MTTERQYKCNFCGESVSDGIESGSVRGIAVRGIGVRWTADDKLERVVYCSGAENHLCLKCAREIAMLRNQA